MNKSIKMILIYYKLLMSYKVLFHKNPIFKPKIAAFDLDWTLIRPKEANTFPKSKDDWTWLYDKEILMNKLNKYTKDYLFVIITNQIGKQKFKEDLINNVLNELDKPCVCIIAKHESMKKPNKDLFYTMFENEWKDYKTKINYDKSFYIGDAAGRKDLNGKEVDFADSDKQFANNVGIQFDVPEKFFEIEKHFDINQYSSYVKDLKKDKQIIILMIGYPASGKSSFSKKILQDKLGFVHLEKDVLKTDAKMKKEATKYLNENKSIIIDATHGTSKSRKIYIDFAKTNNIDIIAIHINTSIEQSMLHNVIRAGLGTGVKIPNVAYYVFRKKYEEPRKEEGFKDIITFSM